MYFLLGWLFGISLSGIVAGLILIWTDSPKRNCDVGTAEEQHARYDKFCNTQKHCQECPCYSAHSCPSWCALNWAQMPYEKGE